MILIVALSQTNIEPDTGPHEDCCFHTSHHGIPCKLGRGQWVRGS